MKLVLTADLFCDVMGQLFNNESMQGLIMLNLIETKTIVVFIKFKQNHKG